MDQAPENENNETATDIVPTDAENRDESVREVKEAINESRTLLGTALAKLDHAASRLSHTADPPFSDLENQ